MVTFFTFAGPATFGSGGNIDLMGLATLTINGSITFVRNDLLGGLQWIPVSQWNPTGMASSQAASVRAKDLNQAGAYRLDGSMSK